MNHLLVIILWAWFAGITAFFGGSLAFFETTLENDLKSKWIHGLIAFGGGVLLAAVVFALLPHSIRHLAAWQLAVTFVGGGLLFAFLDTWLNQNGGASAQFMAMLMDFVPEALSLGAVFSQNRDMGLLLAGFIALQNFPEGFNAFRELHSNGLDRKRILLVLACSSILGPLAALTGYYFLQERPQFTAGIMAFASGGILYLIFQDIAPQSRMKRHYGPALSAVLGFLLGLMGHLLLLRAG